MKMGKIHYFDWAIFNSYFDITKGYISKYMGKSTISMAIFKGITQKLRNCQELAGLLFKSPRHKCPGCAGRELCGASGISSAWTASLPDIRGIRWRRFVRVWMTPEIFGRCIFDINIYLLSWQFRSFYSMFF